MRRVVPAIGLFLLAPLVGEFLLGDLPITALAKLAVLAPFYGGGAVLIREVCRRAGWGWPSMLALALAYGVLEEGITTQTLFNPNWAGTHAHAYGDIPALGMSGPFTVFVLSLHLVWSTTVPILFVELLTRDRRRTPWLGRIGLAVVSVIFVLAVVLLTVSTYVQSGFRASAAQYAGCVVVIAGLIVLAVFLGRGRSSAARGTGRVPSAWLLGAVAFVVPSVELGIWARGQDVVPAWLYVALILLTYAVVLPLARQWTRCRAWTAWHELALGSGALLTYVWFAFVRAHMLVAASPVLVLASHVIFGLGAVALITVTALRLNRATKAECAGAATEMLPTP